MDSFDDFEFKPLTEGLGFHKKTPKNSEPLPPLEPSIRFDGPRFEEPKASAPKIELPELDPSPSLFSKPLPRTASEVEKPIAVPSPQIEIPKFNPKAFGKPLANPAIQDAKIQESGILSALAEIQTAPNKVDTSIEINYTEVAPSPLSLFLDITVIAGLAILFMLGLVVATGLDLVPILTNAGSDSGTQIGVALLAYSVSQLYLILSRSFFGQTLGEWSMDTQLGLPKDQEKISYAFKLIARTLILTATGFIVLPLISMILNKDIAGRAADLKLYRR